MKNKNAIITTLVLVCCFGVLAACGGAQDKKQAQLGAIGAGCKAQLDAVAGEAGAPSDSDEAAVKSGCEKAIHAWRVTK